jgi:outer membrane scaffolding protein for murein synthesis (MipA/OmpV family)
LGDVGATAVGRAFATYAAGPLAVSAEVAGDILGEGHDGFTATVSTSYAVRATDRLSLTLTPSLTWASRNYMQSYFGVSGSQAARSGRRAHEAAAGLKDVTLTLAGAYRLTESWRVSGLLGYGRLLGGAADSPLVKEDGTADQLFGGLGLAHAF